jgi:predicted nucleotidyltransferase
MKKIEEIKEERSVKDIKERILKSLDEMGIMVKNIILFGSRARGDFSKYSDYDFLIITKKTSTIKEKMEICKKVNKALAKLLIPSDIIIKSVEEVEYLKHQIGVVVREALKEGVEI